MEGWDKEEPIQFPDFFTFYLVSKFLMEQVLDLDGNKSDTFGELRSVSSV